MMMAEFHERDTAQQYESLENSQLQDIYPESHMNLTQLPHFERKVLRR